MAFTEQRTINSPTGARLNVYVRQADTAPRAVVQINHGLAEHALRYARFADMLSQHGYITYAYDHRGHGFTKAADAPQGRFAERDGGDKVLADIDALHETISREHRNLPLIIFGHSMGGIITLNYTLRQSSHLAGSAVWNANFSAGALGQLAKLILIWERFRLGADMPSRLLPKLTFQAWGKAVPNHRTLFDWLSRDPAEVDKYIADPLSGWDASVSLWQDLFGFVFHGASDANFTTVRKNLPFMLRGGERDPATDGGKAVVALANRMRAMGFSNLDSKVYAETRHESLNEINRDEAAEDFVRWADRVTGGRAANGAAA
ncbi:MAG TPA: alpha/beta hydrolase [Mesorhizobium sp.]|jgi:alpha-beta hydrolase superfamily lysophospholipase